MILACDVTPGVRSVVRVLWIKDPDPGDPKRPDPTGSGSATLEYIPKYMNFWPYLSMNYKYQRPGGLVERIMFILQSEYVVLHL